MASKQQLYDQLMALQSENALLKRENEVFRSTLLDFYGKTRQALGIEAAIAEREAAKQKALAEKKHGKPKSTGA